MANLPNINFISVTWLQNHQRRVAPALLVLATCLYVLWQRTQPDSLMQAVAGLGLVTLSRLVLVRAAVVFLKEASPSPDRFWRLTTTGLILWLGADIIRLVYYAFLGGAALSPTISDLLGLAGQLAILVAVYNYPLSSSERFGRARNLLEVSILTVGVTALYWLVVARAVIIVGFASWVTLFWASLPIVFQVILVVHIYRLWLHPHIARHRESFRYWLGGLVVLAFTNLLAGYERLLSEPAYGGWLVIGWVAGNLVLATAFLVRMDEIEGKDSLSPKQIASPRAFFFRLERWMPFSLTAAVVGYTLVNWLLSRQFDWVGAGSGIALTTLLIARQGVIAGQAELQQYAALINTSTDLAFISSPDGALLLTNPTMEQWLGESDSSNKPRVPEFITEWPSLVSAYGDAGWAGETQLRNADGASVPVVMSVSPIESSSGTEPLLAVIAHDLTDIRAREQQLRKALSEVALARQDLEALNLELEQKVEERTSELAQMVQNLEVLNQELQEVDQLKSEFVALVSHELRAPLTTIQSGLELILEGNPSLPKKTAQSMQLVQDETLRLSNFVELILDLSALEAGRFALTIEPCSLLTTANVAIKQAEQHHQPLRIEWDIPDGIGYLMADERALVSVYFNLLDNAAKYAPDTTICISARKEVDRIRIMVKDDGPGIPAHDRDRVFDMFHRLDNSDAREVYGYGLGLPMAKRLLQAMGGDIELIDAEQPGACFEFWLPSA